MKITSSEAAGLINLQYGVCFGSVFALLFYLNPPPKLDVVFIIPSLPLILPFIFLWLYYILDWLIANLLKEKLTSVWYVILWTLAIWSLGCIIIMVNSVGSLKYFLLSSYAILTGMYNFLLLKFRATALEILWIFGVAITILLGLYLLYQSIIFEYGHIMEGDIKPIIPLFAFGLLYTKIMRFTYLYQRYGE